MAKTKEIIAPFCSEAFQIREFNHAACQAALAANDGEKVRLKVYFEENREGFSSLTAKWRFRSEIDMVTDYPTLYEIWIAPCY